MDKIKEAASVIVGINQFRNGVIQDYELIKIVCDYYDKIKGEALKEHELRFLKYIANTVGIPQFFELLGKFDNDIELNEIDLNTISAIIYESTLNLTEDNQVHKYQKEIIDRFNLSTVNRYFLSASTSFGKTHIVFDIIRKMKYENVVLIFPTVALLSENLDRLTLNNNYKYFLDHYSIHTLSEVAELGVRNLFIYTPERFLSFMEKRDKDVNFDFAFIDEIYKIDNDYIIDDEVRENERDVAYRVAVFELLKHNVDALLAGPYIDFHKNNDANYNGSFDRFLADFQIQLLDYNNYEIVSKSYSDIQSGKEHSIDEELTLRFETSGSNKTNRLIQSVNSIISIDQNTIVYCYSTAKVEFYAKKIIDSNILKNHTTTNYTDFIDHLSKKFNSEWILIKALKQGIGIHHGLIPKYIQKEIVSLFDDKQLMVLISTTTITEGVNTSAKNLIALHGKKGDNKLKKFDAKNIAGRAGRFMRHYSGRVISLDRDFIAAINSAPEGIKHKNYDLESPKDEIDLFYTKDEFLKPADRQRAQRIITMQTERDIPDFVFALYKVVSRKNKIEIHDRIKALNINDIDSIKRLIRQINSRLRIDLDGFQVVLDVIYPIVLNKDLRSLIEKRDRNEKYSILTHLVQNYLSDGFMGSVRYKMNEREMAVDIAFRETSRFVYNTLKYQVVKYLGVFNVMYKLSQSLITQQPFHEISGIDRLLTKLEYNALTPAGRIASDYGVSSTIIDYYENSGNAENIKAQFDSFEKRIFNKVEKIVRRNN